ncbi:RHS repeat-associated core domain-containing protein [Chryseobacterium sp. IT-36CA2]|uniref:RHS repeat-associated core domain-containing protein n=1 Tax=Chryseobacterium sp. IT-36CA2 TaxID=3026460 RepID=UPI0039DFAB4B
MKHYDKKMKLFSAFILSLWSVLSFSQTILYQAETTSRTVQDPQTVVMAQGFHAKADISNPFVAKIGPATDNPGGGPTDSNAGANNPSGTTAPNEKSFHDTKGNIEVNQAGQLQFTLPISLPPGVKAIAPQTNLIYTSGTGNSIAGYGWNLSGITSISRTGRTIEKDGRLTGIQLDFSDYYSFNGERLILKSGEYGKSGAEYTTEKYSNIKIKSIGTITNQSWQGPEYWEVNFEDGSQAWYGAITSGNSTARTPLEYNIVKWKDTQGNYIAYNYIQSDNVAIISQIEWGGNETNGKPHFNKLQFNYNNRSLNETAYFKDNKFIQSKILKNIEVYTNNNLLRKYEIEYENPIINNNSQRSTNYQFVKKIWESNANGEKANPIVFSTKPLLTSVNEQNFISFDNIITTGDYNGDGLIDFIVRQPAQNGKPEGYYIYFDAVNNGNPSFVYLGTTSTFWPSSDFTTFNIKPTDNYIKPKQGLIISKKNAEYNPPSSGNIELKYYSIKSDASVLNTYNNPLVLEHSKTIQSASYIYADSLYPPETDPDYLGGLNVSHPIDIKEVDIDSDGMSELVMSLEDKKCKYVIIVPDPPKGRWQCKTQGNRYLIVDNDDLQNNTIHIPQITTPKNILGNGGIMDFDKDGKQDILFIEPTGSNTQVTYLTKNNTAGFNGMPHYEYGSKTINTPLNTLKQYNLTKEGNNYNINLAKSHTVKGLSEGVQFADLNGDGNIEVLLPLALRLDSGSSGGFNGTIDPNNQGNDGWSIYLNKGNNLDESFRSLVPYNPNGVEESGSITNYYKNGFIDINGDGKTDIIKTLSKVNYVPNMGVYKTFFYFSILSEFQYNENATGYKWENEKLFDAFSKEYDRLQVTPIFGNFRINNRVNKLVLLTGNVDNQNDRKIIYYNNFNLQSDQYITKIDQGDNLYEITYQELDPVINPNVYAPVKQEKYPYMEMERLSQVYAVTQLKAFGKKQDFRYRGYLAHLQGRGAIGFRQTARSSWYADGMENTKIWNGTEIDPLNEGVPIKEWSIRTNNESNIFPADLSENNTQLLSFKSTIYQTDKLLNGQVVNSISDADKPNIVIAVIPKSTKIKDFLTNTTTEGTVTYGNYYLPVQSESKINNGYGITTSTFEYINNPNGTGADYYIGRPKSKTDIVQAYGDTKSAKEEYTYENNLLKNQKTWNRDNTGWLQTNYNYDSFGNIIQKTTINSIDSQTQTQSSQYDPQGKSVMKTIDNLGLETNIIYNDQGQIIKQTDPLGNTLDNVYDNWGKLLKSKTNLGGTTTYEYEKNSNSNIIITQYDPDGNISKKYTNKWGQEYKTSTKAFGQGQYLSKDIQYDALGRKKTESEPYFDGLSAYQWNSLIYDDSVFPAKISSLSFNGKEIETTISGFTTTVKETNGNGRTTSKTTDALGNTISTTDKGGTIVFSYNAAGEQIKAQYAENIVTTKYDVWGRKTEFNDPSNGIYKYEYDGFGQPKKTTSPKGTKEYTYNNLGQLISQKEKSVIDGGQATDKAISYTYDSKGRITSRSGTSKGKSFSSNISYDPQGRVLSSSESSNGKYFIQKGITYDDKARVISYEKQLYSSGIMTKVNIENIYSSWNGDLYQVKDKTSGKILWQLKETNDKGQVLRAQLGASEIYQSFELDGSLSQLAHSSAVKQNILKLSYNFNVIKNELENRTTEGDLQISESFDYDTNNRLANWTNPVTGIKPNDNRNVYDTKGRILKNDQVGDIKFDNASKIYQPTGMTLNASGEQNYNNDLIQSITFNENNDPVFIDGEKGDVGFQYGLTSMRQTVTFGGNFSTDGEGKFTKFYSEDGSFEIVKDNITQQEKHIIYIGGSPYESNIVYLKNYTESSGSYKFLHKDYLGSILAISDEAGNKLEQRHYDAWGNLTHLQIGNGSIITDKSILDQSSLLIDRGYTGHEHFTEVGITHMNGRLYDPLLRRFLNADENIQDPYNTQNYNKYGYVMNNPLMYNDPSGEFVWAAGFFLTYVAPVIWGAIIGTAISVGIYAIQSAINNNWTMGGFGKAILLGSATGAVSGGLGQIFSASGFWGTVGNATLAGAGSGGITSVLTGQNFLEGVVKGALIGASVSGISWLISKTVAYYRSKTPDSITSTELKNAGYDLSDNNLNDYYTTDQQIQNDFNRTTGDYQASVDNINTEYKLATNKNLPKGSTLSEPWKQIITNDPRDSGYVLAYTTNRNKNWWEFITKGEKSTVLVAPNLGFKSDVLKQAVFGHEYIHAYHRYIGLMAIYKGKYSNYTESSAYHFTINLLKVNGEDYSSFLNQFYNYGGKFPGIFNWVDAIKNIVNFKK